MNCSALGAASLLGGADDGEHAGAGGGGISGWLPVYDTLEGIRGEVRVSLRLGFYGERAGAGAAGGLSFFAADRLDPALFPYQCLLGFTEELVVEDDPEYVSGARLAETFAAVRARNEARQLLLRRAK